LSNLNRQVLHWTEDIGRLKTTSADEKLRRLTPDIQIEAVSESIDDGNAESVCRGCDVIIDALDNMAARFALNRAALSLDTVFIHGAVQGFEGRITTIVPGKCACLACFLRGGDAPQPVPVIGVTPAVIGSLQAAEAVKAIAGIGRLLSGRMLRYDGLSMRFTEFRLRKNPDCEACAGL
jgi:adenylyltransferase/sulfurtransferase